MYPRPGIEIFQSTIKIHESRGNTVGNGGSLNLSKVIFKAQIR
jgi:hypothetical protein